MNDVSHINSALNQNRQMLNNISDMKPAKGLSYQSDSFTKSQNQVQYYNDEKKAKRNKLKKALIIAFGTITSLGAIAATLTYNRNYTKVIDGIKHLSHTSPKKNLDKATNAMSNFTNIKDDYYSKFEDWTEEKGLGFIKNAGAKITGFYKKCIIKAKAKKYDELVNEVKKLSGGQIEPEEFQKWFDRIDGEIYDTLHTRGNRVTDGLLNKDIFNKVTQSNIADTKIANLKSVLNADKPINLKGLNNFDLNDEKQAKLADAILQLNKLKKDYALTIIPKLRDINAGSAPTDVLTIAGSVGTLAGAVALAEDKKEKKSIMLNLGIPLGMALGSTMIGVFKCLSGAKMLAFGLIAGQIASFGAKFIDMSRNKKAHEESRASV